MKRDPALAPLSHDHHQALFIAQRLRRATPESALDDRAAFLAFWETQGESHFELEERVLFPAFAGHGDAHHPLLARALCEHVDIRHRARKLAAGADGGAGTLQQLGICLAEHVRLEERELFPLIEGALPAEDLVDLAAALQRADDRSPDG
jgi:hemerythrin-like domain-containing protein